MSKHCRILPAMPDSVGMPPQILIIDESPILTNVFRHKLKNAGYDVITCSTGAQALTQARKRPPSIIILDLALPDMSGLDLLRQVREHPQLAVVPVIIVTACSDHRLLEAAKALDVTKVLMKASFSLQELLQCVSRAKPVRRVPLFDR